MCLIDLTNITAVWTEQAFHQIVEEFVLDGTFKGHLVQPPCNEQGYLYLDQVAHEPHPT